MSKPNRRKEIKEKEALQLKFQLALSESNKNVLNWLPKSDSAQLSQSSSDKHQFLELPVVPPGAGLYEIEKSETNSSFNTIGHFLGEELPSRTEQSTVRDNRTGSKAMSALMNKMRTDNRRNMEKTKVQKPNRHSKYLEDVKEKSAKQSNQGTNQKSTNQGTSSKSVGSKDLEDSDEESKSKHIQRKQTGFKGKKARPF